jgi:flavodoxin/NAD-dependent dihydropyrimidine dehydrogenase PreA subunit
MKKAAIMYFSASGNTEKVAQQIASELKKQKLEAILVRMSPSEKGYQEAISKADIIFLGTPTYMWHTPAIMNDFLKNIHSFENKPVGLFATFGAVTVGSNLSNMARKVHRKNGRITGALQLEGEHSMMFRSENPLAQHKPAEDTHQYISDYVARCIERSQQNKTLRHIPGIMKYAAAFAPPVIVGKFMPSLKFNSTACTLCEKCIEACPMDNIALSKKTIQHGSSCISCYNCVRVCPVQAVDADLESMDKGLRMMAKLPEKSAAVY